MLDRRAIPYLHWQARLGRGKPLDAAPWGEIVHGLDDVEQAIMTVVLTEKGSVPGQPEKCCRLAPYIDRRPDTAIPAIAREIFDALTIWEPRIVVDRVFITRVDFAQWSFPVFWRLRADVTRELRRTVVWLSAERQPGTSYAA